MLPQYLGWLANPQLSPQESLPVFQAIWIATVSFRSQSISVGLLPTVRRDLRHACQGNRISAWTISALDYRRMVRLPGLADDFVPEFPLPSNARIRFWRSRRYHSPPSSRISGKTAFD